MSPAPGSRSSSAARSGDRERHARRGVLAGRLGADPRHRDPRAASGPIALVIFVSAFSCTGLGLICAAAGLRVRETAVLNNIIFGLLLIFTGANVPLDELPGWMQAISNWIPLTHGSRQRGSWRRRLGDVSTCWHGVGNRRRLPRPATSTSLHGAGSRARAGAIHERPRLLWVGWRFYVKNLTLSSFYILTSVLQPIIFASVAYFMFEAGARKDALRRARRRDDGDLVVDAVRLRRRDPVAAVAGSARVLDRRAAAAPARDRAVDDRDRVDRALFADRDAVLGLALLRRAARRGPSGRVPRRTARGRPRARAARPRSRLHLRALPERQRTLEPARVPGLARDRPARVAVTAPGLGGPAVLGAGTDVGHQRAPRGRDRGQPLAGDRDVPPPQRRLPRHRPLRAAALRAARSGAGDLAIA